MKKQEVLDLVEKAFDRATTKLARRGVGYNKFFDMAVGMTALQDEVEAMLKEAENRTPKNTLREVQERKTFSYTQSNTDGKTGQRHSDGIGVIRYVIKVLQRIEKNMESQQEG